MLESISEIISIVIESLSLSVEVIVDIEYVFILFKVPNSRDNVYSRRLSACYP